MPFYPSDYELTLLGMTVVGAAGSPARHHHVIRALYERLHDARLGS